MNFIPEINWKKGRTGSEILTIFFTLLGVNILTTLESLGIELRSPTPFIKKIEIGGDLWVYGFSLGHSEFGEDSHDWYEGVGRLSISMDFVKEVSFSLRLLGRKTADYDILGTTGEDMTIDLASMSLKNIFGLPLNLTVGKQELIFGDEFLIGDGVIDKYALIVSPERSFKAVRLAIPHGSLTADLFAAEVDDSISDDAALYGLNFHLEGKKRGAFDLGIFTVRVRDDTDKNWDTTALSLRGAEISLLPISGLTFGGEIVKEFGNAGKVNRDAWGGHIDVSYVLSRFPFEPFIKLKHIHFSGDKGGSRDNEAFDPLFYGFLDWGTWWIGHCTSYTLFNSNEVVNQLEIGCSPTSKCLLRLQYFDIDLDKGKPDDFSKELNIIFDYCLSRHVYMGFFFGMANPNGAAKALFGNKNFSEIIYWFCFSF